MFQLIAQRINNPVLGPLGALSGTAFFNNLLPALVSLGFVVGIIVFVFMLVSGGIAWIASGGDKVAYESARRRITNAIVGLVILLGFFAILNIIECFFGLGLRQFKFGPFNITPSSAICPKGGGGGGGTCTPSCTAGYFCSTVGSISECCKCVYGNDATDFGPVTCCTPPAPSSGNCNTYNVNGCRANP